MKLDDRVIMVKPRCEKIKVVNNTTIELLGKVQLPIQFQNLEIPLEANLDLIRRLFDSFDKS